MLSTIRREQSLRSQALEHIRHAIVNGTLEAGSMHSEQAIADQLQISRTPVREALLQIAQDGLVEFVPQRGVRIAPFNAKHLVDVMEFRAALEGYAAATLAMRRDEERIRALRRELDRQRAIVADNDGLQWVEANIDFHSTLVESLQNELIASAFPALAAHTMRIGFKMIARRERKSEALIEHEAVVDAIEYGQCEAARHLAVQHLLVTKDMMTQLLADLRIGIVQEEA